jgi:uncharacterized protein (TIGR02145 family)
MLGTFGFSITDTSIPSAELLTFTAEADVQAPPAFAVSYQWSAPDLGLVSASGPSITFSPSPSGSGLLVVPVTLTAKAAGHCDKVVERLVCAGGTPPGSTVTFTAFTPCLDAPIGSVWYLTDTRESNNLQTYKVRKMEDGHIWMVQDLKFGNLCGTEFSGSSVTDQSSHVSDVGTYYGDCTTLTDGSTPANRGYLYDWAAAVNKAGAYYGSSSNVGCSGTVTGSAGTAPGACQGICPADWHIPTGATTGEFYALQTANGGCVTTNDNCWNKDSAWEGVRGGYSYTDGTVRVQGTSGYYWSSTVTNGPNAKALYFHAGHASHGHSDQNKYYGFLVRCVRNY